MLWIQKDFLPAISRTRFRQFLLSTFSIFTRSIQCTILGGIRLIKRNVDSVFLPGIPACIRRTPTRTAGSRTYPSDTSGKIPHSGCSPENILSLPACIPSVDLFFFYLTESPVHGTRTSFSSFHSFRSLKSSSRPQSFAAISRNVSRFLHHSSSSSNSFSTGFSINSRRYENVTVTARPSQLAFLKISNNCRFSGNSRWQKAFPT